MGKSSTAALRWVKVTDAEGLKAVGCPWSTKTLRTMHSQGKYPGLIVKLGGKLVLAVDVLNGLLQDKVKEAQTATQ